MLRVGTWAGKSTFATSLLNGTPSARAIRTMFINAMLRSPRSTAPA